MSNTRTCFLFPVFLLTAPLVISAETEAELKARIQQLEKELLEARQKLEVSQQSLSKANQTLRQANDTGPKKIRFDTGEGELLIGGSLRANYSIGDYQETGAPSQAPEDGGNVALGTFALTADYLEGPFQTRMQYRFYDGYHFLHTGWLGYTFEDKSQIQAGVNRVPFGPGPFGVSQSWFFDQHYYVGLADDMDLGIKYTKPWQDWTFDVAYYYSDEGTYAGSSADSARYSYDIVDESGSGYEERNQFNLRGIYAMKDVTVPTDLGFSLQYGQLKSNGSQDDGDHTAGSVHMVNKYDQFTLLSQLSYFRFNVDEQQPLGTDKRVQTGAFDFPSTAAAEGWIPAASLSYKHLTPRYDWLDYVLPYIEYSTIIKTEESFNDSQLLTLGAAWIRGGWYIYTDYALSNGNEFVGGESAFGDRLGANADDPWQSRFNIEFGYYF